MPNKLKNGEGQIAQAQQALESARRRLRKATEAYDVEYYNSRILYETRRLAIWRRWLALPVSARADAALARDCALRVESEYIQDAEVRRGVAREEHWLANPTPERPDWRQQAHLERQRRINERRIIKANALAKGSHYAK